MKIWQRITIFKFVNFLIDYITKVDRILKGQPLVLEHHQKLKNFDKQLNSKGYISYFSFGLVENYENIEEKKKRVKIEINYKTFKFLTLHIT